MATSIYARRLGPHHFAHLRAVAEGLPLQDAAKRYLGVEHGHEAITAHRLVADQVRAAARRRGEREARLVGLQIRVGGTDKPSLEDFIAERGLDGWSEAEIVEMYEEAFGSDPKAARRERLRTRQIELLRKLEFAVAEAPSPTDFIGGWFDESLARKMVGAGFNTLGELNAAISAGGAWFKNLPAVGKAKAARMERFVRTLLPREAVALPFFGSTSSSHELKGVERFNPHHNSLLGQASMADSVSLWISAKANSEATKKVYAREVGRFLVWLRHERPGAAVHALSVADAVAFSEFLQEIPERYISRRKASPGELGWAPFRGQLTPTSRKQALQIVSAWLDWLVVAKHIAANPFALISKKQGDGLAPMTEVKAFTEGAMQAVLARLETLPPSPALTRVQFILRFVEATGLRSRELLDARLSDLVTLPEGLALQVKGKGMKNRLVPMNRQAREALADYLEARGLGDLGQAPQGAPLLASATDPMAAISYSTLYETVRLWVSRAVQETELPGHERARLVNASTHWLRHTFGTRAVEKGAPLDAVQAAMGHASPNTTARYSRASAQRQFAELGKVFGE